MKKIMFSLALAIGLMGAAQDAKSQLKLPSASTKQSLTQELGIGTIELNYQRPSARGREIFGQLVPFGEVWRTGANDATAITFSTDVQIEGKPLPAGTYGLFTIPGEKEWTIIFNKNSEQWGAYTYEQADDVLRVVVPTHTVNTPLETFTISFDDVLEQSLTVSLAWANQRAAFQVSTDQSKEILASIQEAMNGDKKPYFQAAVYFYKNDIQLDNAAKWITEADKGNEKAPHIKYWKSLILAKSGDKSGAIKAAEEGIAMAKSADNTEYIRLNTQALEDAKK